MRRSACHTVYLQQPTLAFSLKELVFEDEGLKVEPFPEREVGVPACHHHREPRVKVTRCRMIKVVGAVQRWEPQNVVQAAVPVWEVGRVSGGRQKQPDEHAGIIWVGHKLHLADKFLRPHSSPRCALDCDEHLAEVRASGRV